ncbi:hypothetical protein [Methylobacterium brachiatum]|jgi:hypothetical protein
MKEWVVAIPSKRGHSRSHSFVSVDACRTERVREQAMPDRRIMIPMPDAGRMSAIVDAIETRMAHHRRTRAVAQLLADAHAPYCRPGAVGTALRRRIAAEGHAP